jgi:hypothetical protein
VRPHPPRFIQCEECHAIKLDQAPSGWRAYVVDSDNVAVYCAVCADREFGE